jgi:hypothetical protein
VGVGGIRAESYTFISKMFVQKPRMCAHGFGGYDNIASNQVRNGDIKKKKGKKYMIDHPL